ncbi:MAG: DUF721 domain-containing protein [Chlorobi bacterium]|nr:DUF721 domain-containing protein [Chlorobiota bacterium]
MKRSNTEKIGEVIRDYLKEMNLDRKLKEVSLVNEWEDLVGIMVAKRTDKLYIRDGVLYVHVRSSVVKNELMMIREGLIKALNEKAGEKMIHDIVFR